MPLTQPQPAEAVLLAEWEAAEVLWTEGQQNDTYHETETLDDAWERLFREHVDALPILELNAEGFFINKYHNGRYMRVGINCPDQIRRAKSPQFPTTASGLNEMIQRLRDAGMDAWDGVEDINAEIGRE